nr:lysophospholipid acyltransferase family protein [Alteribacter salitolerans]
MLQPFHRCVCSLFIQSIFPFAKAGTEAFHVKKKPLFEALFSLYNKRLLSKHFHTIKVKNDWVPSSHKRGVLFYINHSSWWDSLVLFQLNRYLLKQDGYALMSEDGLKKFPFFMKLGAFPVNSSSYTSVLRSLTRASSLLDEGKALFVFPQGEERHVDERPFTFQHGTSYLIQKARNCEVVPITFYHTLFHEQHPEFFIHIGKSVSIGDDKNRQAATRQLEKAMTIQLDAVKRQVVNGKTEHFDVFVDGSITIGEKWYRFKKKAVRLTGREEN